jgi:hypothetical protein
MEVSLRNEDETSGWLSKSTEYALYVKVKLKPEERTAIEKANIKHYVMIPYSYKGAELNWTVGSVVHSSDKDSERRIVSADAVARNELEKTVADVLKALKSQIEVLSSGSDSRSFEI